MLYYILGYIILGAFFATLTYYFNYEEFDRASFVLIMLFWPIPVAILLVGLAILIIGMIIILGIFLLAIPFYIIYFLFRY